MGLMRSVRTAVVATAVAGAALMAASVAQAAPISVNGVGDKFSVDFNGFVNDNFQSGLTAEADFLVTAFSNTSITFDVTLTNTSGSGIGSRITSLFFNTTPNLSGGSSTGLFSNFNFPGGNVPNFGSAEACAGANGNCAGGGGGGLTNPSSTNFQITLNFGGPATVFTFDQLGVRYQSITGSNFGNSGIGLGTESTPPAVPEPTTMVLLGTGLLGLASRKLRKA